LEENVVVNRNNKTYFNLLAAYIRKVTAVTVILDPKRKIPRINYK